MSENRNTIRFVLDGIIHEIDFNKSNELKPTSTVLNFLRSLPNHKGVKEGCGEGDCGACTVVIGEYSQAKIIYKAIDSCIMLLPMLHGKQLITVENLAIKEYNKTILHPVQKAVVENNGTQCGYCTPGFVMSIFALYKNVSKPSKEEVQAALTGNLCRCTGYEPIIKASIDACSGDMKDQFNENEKNIVGLLKKIRSDKSTIDIKTKFQRYFKVFSIKEALVLKSKYPDGLLLSGATDIALRVTKKHELIPLIIDVSEIDELKQYKSNRDNIVIGAGLSLENIRNLVGDDISALQDILNVFGSKQIRSVATLGGNVASASPIGDAIPLLMVLNATIGLESIKRKREVRIADFIKSYRTTDCMPDELMTHIIIPKPSTGTYLRVYKISKRKDLDISTVSAAFRLTLDKKLHIREIFIAYGGMAATTKRANEAEQFLSGKKWSEKLVVEGMEIIRKEFHPLSDARAGEEFRRIAAANLLLKFFNEINVR